MAIRTIYKQGDPVLNKKCHPVTQFDQKLWDLLDDLRETLDQANGVGLAAPQIGILRRVVIVINQDDEVIELVNPEIIDQRGEQEGLEDVSGVAAQSQDQPRQETAEEPQEDVWGLTLSAEEITPTGLTVVFTQSGGEVSGQLETGSVF